MQSEPLPGFACVANLLLVCPDNALTSPVVRFASLTGLLIELRIRNAEQMKGCTCHLDVLVPPHALLPLTASHFVSGAPGMLTQNVCVAYKLANGTSVTFHSITLPDDQSLQEMIEDAGEDISEENGVRFLMLAGRSAVLYLSVCTE